MRLPHRSSFALAALLAFATAACNRIAPAAETATLVPPPTVDERAAGSAETAVLAGGCFWGMEAVFEHVKGVKSVQSGYAGGTAQTAKYEVVATEKTRHAEAIKIVYDARQVSFERLLQIYFAVAHDPTQLNRQGPDVGPSYRSAVFPQSAEQRRIAAAYIAQLGKTGAFKRPIVTRIEGGRFYPAEAYHQDFMRRNPTHPYIVAHDPTQLNRQGPDVGSSYRSAIFPQNAVQQHVARAYIGQLAAAHAYPRPIVTRIESGPFFDAESYHQDFMAKNPRHPYILAHDVPKLAAFKRAFGGTYQQVAAR